MKGLLPPNDRPETWPSLIVVAATLWGEARGESLRAKVSVGFVIRNRRRDPRWPDSWRGVCLQRWQFSAWNESDPNRQKMMDPLRYGSERVWLDCLAAARVVMDGTICGDKTDRANHYHDTSIDPPSWAKDGIRTYRDGAFIFYRL